MLAGNQEHGGIPRNQPEKTVELGRIFFPRPRESLAVRCYPKMSKRSRQGGVQGFEVGPKRDTTGGQAGEDPIERFAQPHRPP